MPLILNNEYKPSRLLRNGHVMTIYASKSRKAELPDADRKRFETPDKDFFDVDFFYSSSTPSDRIVILLHGLEGSSDSSYIHSSGAELHRAGFDVAAINHRGCSGEDNRKPESYYSCRYDDLDQLVELISSRKSGFNYKEIYIAGFSLGGNITLYYAGIKGRQLNRKVKKVMAVSVPIDLTCSSRELETRLLNRIYLEHFVVTLKQKIRLKKKKFPHLLDTEGLWKIHNFTRFDNRYTGPMNGYRDAHDYWSRCSSLPLLNNIKIPALILNAHDDPFLGENCYPRTIARASRNITLEETRYGGHCGFLTGSRHSYFDTRMVEFFLEK